MAIFLVFMYSQIADNSKNIKELKGFNPYDILAIPKDTECQDFMFKIIGYGVFGVNVDTRADFNGDGIADIIIGASQSS